MPTCLAKSKPAITDKAGCIDNSVSCVFSSDLGGVVMYAERLMVETDVGGKLKSMPVLPPNKHFEAIFLQIDDDIAPPRVRRRPHPDLVGGLVISGDVLDSAPVEDWGLPE